MGILVPGSAPYRFFSDILHALEVEVTTYNVRGIAFGCLTVSFVIHSCFITSGLRPQNALGLFKLIILILIAIVGMAYLTRVPGFELKGSVKVLDNLRWSQLLKGSGNSATAFVAGPYNIIW